MTFLLTLRTEALDAAKAYFKDLPDDGFATVAHKSHAWKLIARTPPADAAAETARVKALLEIDAKRRAAKTSEFKQRYAEKEKFKNPHKQDVKASEWSPVEGDASTASAATAVGRQTYACVGLVREDEKKGQRDALVMFLAAFDSEKECRRYARDTAAHKHRDVDLFCVRMYEWVLVDDAYKCENWGFRHKKLDDFFQTRLNDNIEAERFAKRCYNDPTEKPKMLADAK